VLFSATGAVRSWPNDRERKNIYWTLGQYDIVATVEARDDLAITTLGLTLAKSGNGRTQTLRAFAQAEMGSILSKVG
jgi:uncharacterized protein with GYD domain